LDVRLIAEPWDAAGAYQSGRNFPGISTLQWNDRFRDDVRRFVRGDPGMVGALMSRLYGSDDFFLAFCLHGASQQDVGLYMMINAYWEDLTFTI
jgi:isoamylase